MMIRFVYLYDRLFKSNKNFTTEHVKIVKIPGFFNDFCSKFQVFFCLNVKFQVFPGFQPCKMRQQNLNFKKPGRYFLKTSGHPTYL